MNLKKMLKLCKDERHIMIRCYGNQKFLCNGYIMANMMRKAPYWSADDCATALEISEDDRAQYHIGSDKYSEIDINNIHPLEVMEYTINIKGAELQPLLTDDMQVLFINCDLLSVFKDEQYKEFSQGNLNNDNPMVFIKNESEIIGVIAPIKVDLVAAERYARALAAGANNSKKSNLYDLGGQMSIFDNEDNSEE